MLMPDLSGATAEQVDSFHKSTLFVNGLDSTKSDKFDLEYIEALRKGGVNAMNITAAATHDNFRGAMSSFIAWRNQLRPFEGEHLVFIKTASDIERAFANNKIGVIFGLQGANPIEDELGLIERLHEMGFRIIQLTYNRRNFIGDGVAETSPGGLSKFGRNVVSELNHQRIVVDLAHVGERTALEAVEVSSAPTIVSHSSSKALCNHFRPISDDLMRAVAASGGVVGVAALSIFLREDAVQNGSTIDDYLNHMEHAIEVAGIDHVAVGFDVGFKRTDEDTKQLEGRYPEFKFPPLNLRYVTELNRMDKASNVTHGLVKRGYSAEDITKILSGNWMRVFRQVWG